MDDYENLSHSKWECKYDGVFIPKYRRKTLYGELRQHLGEVFRRLAIQKESWVEEGHLMPDHVHMMISIQRPHRAALSGPKPKAPGFAGGYLPTAYGTGKLLAWLLGKSITPHIPVWERYPSSDGMFSRSEFTYDAERDVYVCPNGKLLRTSGTVHDGRVRNYLSQLQDCRACTFKQRCTRAPFKKIARDINEDARNHARSLKNTPEFERSSNARKKVEMRFAHLKVQHGFERMRLRGLTGARDEFHLAAIVQNLKTMALRLVGPPTRGARAAIG